MTRDARRGDYVELLKDAVAYQRENRSGATRLQLTIMRGSRGVCDGYLAADSDELGTIFVLIRDYYVVVDRGDYRILTPLEVLAGCA